jgi:glyoxylase-like metal-dependent hydrolase (beta-lactamase superfamily II)
VTLVLVAEQTEHWQIGDVGLTAIVEAETSGIPPQFFFPDIVADDVTTVDWLSDGAASTDGTIAFRVQAFVVETGGRVVLVDPCVGNAKQRGLPFWNDLQLPWLERFTQAGFDPATVDLVVHTHLHEDHIGWDTHRRDGEWVPTFANARHVYVGDELDYAVRADRRTKDDPYADSIAPILDAGLGDIVGADATLADGVRLVSTPGHTPGHVAVAIDTSGDPLVISGDLLHHQVQLANPRLAEIADWDVELARQTRSAFFSEHARAGSIVAGTHFSIAPVGRIEPNGAAWRFRVEAGSVDRP